MEVIRTVLKRNVAALMAHHPDLDTQMRLAKASGLEQTTISRVLRAEVAVTLDTIAKIASAFDLDPWQLLVEDLDPTNPPVIAQASPDEAALYAKLREAAALLRKHNKAKV